MQRGLDAIEDVDVDSKRGRLGQTVTDVQTTPRGGEWGLLRFDSQAGSVLTSPVSNALSMQPRGYTNDKRESNERGERGELRCSPSIRYQRRGPSAQQEFGQAIRWIEAGEAVKQLTPRCRLLVAGSFD